MIMKFGLKGFIILAFTLLFIAGCQDTGTSAPTGYYKYTGDKAVEASFATDAPVSSTTDTYTKNEDISVLVELTNKLTQDIPAGKVKLRLSGDASISNFFTGAREKTAPKLDALDLTTGGSTTEEIEMGPIKYVGELTAKVSKVISGKYCYEMPVKAKANLFYTDKVADVGTNLPKGSNPASRVQITALTQGIVKVDKSTNKGKLKFKLTVKNKGSGRIISSLSECFKYPGKRPREKLNVNVRGAYPITCENNGDVTLSLDTSSKVVDCEVTNIDPANLGKQASELAVTLSNFAYEEELQPVTIYLEP
jgi:hypothetical protein